MKKNFRKAMAIVLSLAMVLTTFAFSSAKVDAATLTQDQLDSINNEATASMHNLAKGIVPDVEPGHFEGSPSNLTNGSITGGHCAISPSIGYSGDSYVEIDLGATYKADSLDEIILAYNDYGNGQLPGRAYNIQYSFDESTWNTVASNNAVDASDLATSKAIVNDVSNVAGKVRYIKVYYPTNPTYGIQMTEVAVLAADPQLAPADKCDPCAAVNVSCPYYKQLTYSIVAGEGQENYSYFAYIGNDLVGSNLSAGTEYTLDNVIPGNYQVSVVSHVAGKDASDPKVSDTVTVDDPVELYSSDKNVATNGDVIDVSSFYNENYTLTTSQCVLDGTPAVGEGSSVCTRSAANVAPISITVDLGSEYNIKDMKKVLLSYSNPRTYAANTTISVSSDNDTYTTVANHTGYVCKRDGGSVVDTNLIDLDLSTYTDTFRYIQLELSGGVNSWGYCVNQIGVIIDEDAPDNYMDVTPYKATTPATAPTKAGKIFAGWFEDAAFTTPYMGTTGYAYAKFIDEKALTVKFQTADDGSAVRFVSTIDDNLDYQSVGFKFTGTYGNAAITEKTKTVNSVFEKISGGGHEYIPSTAFENDDSAYFFTYTVRGMTNAKTSSTWNVTPFYVTPDGTTVEGTAGSYPVD